MGDRTGISWADASWNPVTGCDKVSSGCDHCYAEIQALRLRDQGAPSYVNGFKLTLQPDKLNQPIRWTRPRKVFVNSMSDLHHKDIPKDYLDKVYDVMLEANWHIFQALTKRSSLMRDYINARFSKEPVPAHIWLGVSVENAAAKTRIEHLKQVNAKIRFLSLEPLIEDPGILNLDGIHWVIVGCESPQGGAEARPMSLDWARSIRDQCQKAGVAFFLKQIMENGEVIETPTLDGRQWLEFPSMGGS